jgi:F-type H+-transporting ATPase subunit a
MMPMASLFTLLAQEASKAAEPGGAGHAAAAAAEHGGGEKVDAGHLILEHILDSHTLELPGFHVPLPQFHLLGLDLSITKYVVMMWIASVILLTVGILAARIHRHSPGRLGHLIEMAILFIRDELAVPNIGKHGARFVPYLLTTFLFILVCNLMGLVPYGATATGNISVTAALALMAFVMIQLAGIREFGTIKHFKNLVPHGVPMWLLPLMIPVEIAGMLIKPVTLCVRLFANMLGGHIVILSLLGLIFILANWIVVPVSVGFALFINLLELLVAFIQAYIFTMLTSLFIGMSVHPH